MTSEPTAADTGQVAWLNLRNMAVALGQNEEVRWLGADQLDLVDWLVPDLPFLPALREELEAR